LPEFDSDRPRTPAAPSADELLRPFRRRRRPRRWSTPSARGPRAPRPTWDSSSRSIADATIPRGAGAPTSLGGRRVRRGEVSGGSGRRREAGSSFAEGDPLTPFGLRAVSDPQAPVRR
jgi:hypothetical protein